MDMALALPRERFSIVTIAAAATPAPAWTRRLNWPAAGDADVALPGAAADARGIWAARLDAAVVQADRAVLLVAEGAGCLAASWWARLSPRQYVARVAGALLLDPADAPADAHAAFAAPPVALPFPSLVVARDASADGVRALVDGWGSALLAGGRQRAGGERAWGAAQRLIARVTAAVVEHDVERVLRLRAVAA